MTNIPSLLVDLVDAEKKARRERVCPLCEHLRSMPAGVERDTLTQAAAGTIGVNTLVAIFQRHDIPVGRRTLVRHRSEEHSPS